MTTWRVTWPPGSPIYPEVHAGGSWPEEQLRALVEHQARRRPCPRCDARPTQLCMAPTGMAASGPHAERLEGR